MKFYIALTLVLASMVLMTQAIVYKDCGSKTGAIVDVSVTNCTQLPCVFVRGNDYSISIKFKSSKHNNIIIIFFTSFIQP